MSKSNSSTRSNSVEATAECVSELGSPKSGVAPLLEANEPPEGNEPLSSPSLSLPSSSPPPSYEYVLKESRLREQKDESLPSPQSRQEIYHKSSKELYKAVAKQFGITCKMSDQCRCFDCQSHYFDCEYEQNENEKTDGGLGAGTPMFISEVMHGTACNIL